MSKSIRFLAFAFVLLIGAAFLVPQARANTLTPYTFNAFLHIGMRGDAVQKLQEVLNQSADTQVAIGDTGAPGREGTYFGALTQAAVIKFQNKYASEILIPADLTTGNGRVGYYTLKKLNELRAQYSAASGPITTAAASNVTSTTATLNASYIASTATTAYFKYMQEGSNSFSYTSLQNVSIGSGSLSTTVSGLVPNAVYDVWGCIASVACDANHQTFTTSASEASSVVMTDPATNIGTTYATLNATLSASQSVSGYFEYGTDYNFGMTTTPVAYGSGTSSYNVSLYLFYPETTYHVRACVNTAVATAICDPNYQTFTTSGYYYGGGGGGGGNYQIAPTVSTGVPALISPASAYVYLSYVANNNSVTPFFEYGTSSNTSMYSVIGPTASSNGSYSLTLSGLTPNTLYYAKGCLNYASGAVCDTNTQTFTTPANSVSATVTTAAASAINITGATLAAQYTSSGTPVIHFEYGLTTSYGSTTGSAILANGSATAVVAGLSQDTTYHYRAVDVDGNTTIDGSDMTFITTYTPVTVTTTAVDTITSTSAHLNASFTSPTGNPHILFVYGPTTSYGSTTGVATIVEGTSVTFAVTGLTPNTLYHYKPIDVDFNVTTPGADMTFTTATAVTLSTPTPSAITSASATISVNYSGVPVDLSGMTATFFKLQYGTTTSYGSTAAQANSDFVSFNSSGVFTKTLTGLTSGTTYHYRIVTVHQPGNTNEVDSPDATFTTL